jgi:hypothetical protein
MKKSEMNIEPKKIWYKNPKYTLEDVRKYPLVYLDFLDYFILKKMIQKKQIVLEQFYPEVLEHFDLLLESLRHRFVRFKTLGIFKSNDGSNPRVYLLNPDLLQVVKEILFKIEDFVMK